MPLPHSHVLWLALLPAGAFLLLILWAVGKDLAPFVLRRMKGRPLQFSLQTLLVLLTGACVFFAIFRPRSFSELLVALVQAPILLTLLGLAAMIPILAALLLLGAFRGKSLNNPARRHMEEMDSATLAKQLEKAEQLSAMDPAPPPAASQRRHRRKWWRRRWTPVYRPGRFTLEQPKPSHYRGNQ